MDFNSFQVGSNAMEKTKLTNVIYSNGDVCSFPFRFRGILYYACTNITINGTAADELGSPENPIHICATEHNEDFNPIKMGFCDTSFRWKTHLNLFNLLSQVSNSTAKARRS